MSCHGLGHKRQGMGFGIMREEWYKTKLVMDKLNFIEEPVEIMDREVKELKQSRHDNHKLRNDPEAIKELIAQRVAEALANYEETRAANALEAKSQSQNGSDGDNGNGGNTNGKNGNVGNTNGGNGNGNHGDRGNNGN
ncbi:hypothetical protein Tco_1191814 [Tanacetum coccineum]